MILIIIITCLIMYKAGFCGWLLDCFTIPEYETETTPAPAPVLISQEKKPVIDENITEREKLEKQAAVIVAAMGEDSRTVAYMSEGLLRALINDYTQANS